MMILFLILFSIFAYGWLGIQIARFIRKSLTDDEDIILFVIFWPLVVIIGGLIQIGKFVIKQVTGQVKR